MKRVLLVATILAVLAVSVFAKTITVSLNKKVLDHSDSNAVAWFNNIRIAQMTKVGAVPNRPYLKTGASPVVPLNDFSDTQVCIFIKYCSL